MKIKLKSPRFTGDSSKLGHHTRTNTFNASKKNNLPNGTEEVIPKQILEHQEYMCDEEASINKVNIKYKGLLTSASVKSKINFSNWERYQTQPSFKSIKKVTPRRSNHWTKNVKFLCYSLEEELQQKYSKAVINP